MKLYLHEPRQNDTVTLAGIRFVKGVAEFDGEGVPVSLEKYYNVKDYPVGSKPKEEDEKETEYYPQPRSQEDKEKIEEERKLKNLIEIKKQELAAPLKEEEKKDEWKNYPFAKMKKYVEEISGITPRSKREAFTIMGEKL